MKSFEKLFFYSLIFSIPFQTRVFLYSEGVFDGFNEWQSIFLYGTDILAILLFLYWLPNFLKTINFKFEFTFALLFIIIIFAGISIYFASYLNIGIYRFIKLLEFIWLFFYVIRALKAEDALRVKFSGISIALGLSGALQGAIAFLQFLAQHSLGLKYLGESPLQAGVDEVAEIVAVGARFIRAYGTFPSPNVLAAFLAVSILFTITWYISRPYRLHRHFFFAAISLIFMSIGLLLTFSRVVMGVFALCLLFYFLFLFFSKKFEYRFKLAGFHLFLIFLFIGLIFGTIYAPEFYSRFVTNIFELRDLSIVERTFWTSLSAETILESPMGIGAGNFVLYFNKMYPGLRVSLYQPVHNVFLLFSAELGIVASIAFVIFLLSLFYKAAVNVIKNDYLQPCHLLALSLLVFFVGTGLFDHYYLTLQQGGLLLWVGLAVIYYLNTTSKVR